ncbi:MAG: MarR family winged helix-turn-helix transcriptional regulator [Caulobacteraceae bacterium]|nr:MarR family winged helix-turn-helix transcriptional regulator [Caulobacteraceae bacterium]
MSKSRLDDSLIDLNRSPSHLLHRVLQMALDLFVEEAGPGAVTQRQFAVLAAVAADEGPTQSRLVKATGIDRSTLADMVARMIDKGLLTRERSVKDARANSVGLTDLGRHTLSDMTPKVAAADSRLLAHLSAGKRDGFIKLLREFIRSGEETQEGTLELASKPKKKADKAPNAEKKKKKKKKAANDLAV